MLTERIEDVAATCAGHAHLVTVRAVRIDDRMLAAIQTLLRPGGRLLRFGRAAGADPAGFRRVSERALVRPGDAAVLFEKQPLPTADSGSA